MNHVKCETDEKPLVSIIVRTCQRPSVLRETLNSIRNQTYKNLEVVVVEDGEVSAQTMIEHEFTDLIIRYEATHEKKGRSYAGNLALKLSSGEFLNFLDDDDLFCPEHVECLVSELVRNDEMVAYSFGIETPVIVHSIDPYEYEIKGRNKRYTTKFDPVELCYHNYLPIQSVMFSRKLYEELGGFDVTLDYLEDWDLWVRYAQKTKFICVERFTSYYRVPYNNKVSKNREQTMANSLVAIRSKQKQYNITVDAEHLAMYGLIANISVKKKIIEIYSWVRCIFHLKKNL